MVQCLATSANILMISSLHGPVPALLSQCVRGESMAIPDLYPRPKNRLQGSGSIGALGRFPVSSSKSTMPKAYASVKCDTCPFSEYSGGMYPGVPHTHFTNIPPPSSWLSAAFLRCCITVPKSEILACSLPLHGSCNRMLAHLM